VKKLLVMSGIAWCSLFLCLPAIAQDVDVEVYEDGSAMAVDSEGNAAHVDAEGSVTTLDSEGNMEHENVDGSVTVMDSEGNVGYADENGAVGVSADGDVFIAE
jgi:streptogramin lyase